MSIDACMETLVCALQQRLDAGNPVQFWWRDDDAVQPGAALDRLLALSDAHAIPLTLALIPALTGDELQRRLANAPQVSVAVHGWSHRNHAPSGEKKQELGAHRPVAEVVGELAGGFHHLANLYGGQFLPVLVPPWNRIADTVIPALNGIGFVGLSTFADQSCPSIPMINTHVDIIDWKGSRGGRAAADLVSEIVGILHSPQTTIGLLTHHLVHDEKAWSFLEALFHATDRHPAVRWMSAGDVLENLPSPDPGLPQ